MTNAIIAETTLGSVEWITPSTQRGSDDRLSTYLRDFWPRCTDSLAEDFPRTAEILDAQWESTVKNYIRQLPTMGFSLYHLGDNFPNFLQSMGVSDLLVQLASMEKANVTAEISSIHSINTLSADTPLILQPHCTLVSIEFEVESLPKLVQTDPVPLIIFQSDYNPKIESLDPLEALFLNQFITPTCLSDAYDRMERSVSDDSMDTVAEFIDDWMSRATSKFWIMRKDPQ